MTLTILHLDSSIIVDESSPETAGVETPPESESNMTTSIDSSSENVSKPCLPQRTTQKAPNAKDWERIRPTFIQLYIVENKNLQLVMQILKDQYGFNATQTMYKRRISEWNVHKNYKRADKEALLRDLKRLRTAHGTELNEEQLHDFTFKGRPIKKHRLIRYMKENMGADMSSIDLDAALLQALQRGNSRQSDSEHPRTLITETGAFRNTEMLLLSAAHYMDAYVANISIDMKAVQFDNGLQATQFDRGLKPTLFSHQSRGFTQQLESALVLESHGRIGPAFRLINEAMSGVNDILSEQFPTIFSRMFHLFLFETTNSMLMRSAQQHVTEMAKVMLGERHPVVLACATIPTLPSEEDKLHAWKSVINLYRDWLSRNMSKQRLDSDDPKASRGFSSIISAMARLGSFKDAMHDLEVGVEKEWISKSEYLFHQGQMLTGLGQHDEAERKLTEALAEIKVTEVLGDNVSSTSKSAAFTLKILGALAQVLEDKSDVANARERHLQCVKLSSRLDGGSGLSTISTISAFERFLRKQQMNVEADDLKVRYPNVFS